MEFFTKHKLVAGLMGLIALVSVVNTQAIIKMSHGASANKVSLASDNQEAQVLTSSASRCIQVLPVDGTEHSIDYPGAAVSEDGQVLDYNHTFHINFKVKNKCNSDMYVLQDLGIVMPGVYEDPSGLFPGEIQEYNAMFEYGSPSPIVPATDIEFYYSGVWGGYPYVGNLDVLVTNMPGVNLMYNGGAPSSTSTRIPALSERYFRFQSMVQIDSDNFPDYPKAYRMALKKIRWFSQSSYSDGIISANEVKTYVIPSSLSKSLTTSYVAFWNNEDNPEFKNILIPPNVSKEVKESLEKMDMLHKSVESKI